MLVELYAANISGHRWPTLVETVRGQCPTTGPPHAREDQPFGVVLSFILAAAPSGGCAVLGVAVR